MHDLALVGFLATLLAFGFRRPFLFVLAYIYVDVVSPQRLSYYLLNAVPVSLICVVLAVAGWMMTDPKGEARFGVRQFLMLTLLLYCGWTTMGADFPVEAAAKWSWVWKSMAFAIFLPLTLRTRLRVEAVLLFMILSASSIVVVGGIKTLVSGGGYGVLNLMVDNNSGLYESSTISTVAIAIIPLILWAARFGTVFPPDWRVRGYAVALVFACLLIPVGTQARTGLICIGVLALLTLRTIGGARNRALYLGALALAGAAAVPMLPKSYTERMDTITSYQADQSATSRLAIWKWTWEYAQDHPFGGGFDAYRQNKLSFQTVATTETGTTAKVEATQVTDAARAYHSAYFEMLGEQGYPGLAMWLALHIAGLVRMEVVRRRWRGAAGADAWIAPLATALQHCQLIYLVGATFVGISFQPMMLMVVGVGAGFDMLVRRQAAGRNGPARGFRAGVAATA